MSEILEKYLPSHSVIPVFKMIEEHRVHLKIVNERVTRHGDYRKMPSGAHQITVNSTLDLESFKIEFDEFLTKINNSIGWVELSRARGEITSKHTMSQREFYDFVDQLINKYQDEYELSTGGEEGIVVRGLLHGYIRCIQVN